MESFCEEPSLKWERHEFGWEGEPGIEQYRAAGWGVPRRAGVTGGSGEAGTARSQLPELMEITLSLLGQWRQESGERQKG